MDNPGYVALTRQTALLKSMQMIANNIANMSTTGYRREGLVFAEMLAETDGNPGTIAMTAARVRTTDTVQGQLSVTGGTLDFALEGPGFFQVETAEGIRLTRTGSFAVSPEGELVTQDGLRVLDQGGAPVIVPPEATKLSVGTDGTIDADGTPIGQLGVVEVSDPASLVRSGRQLFEGGGEILPAGQTRVIQGSLEGSNVDPVAEMTRMIAVQRTYELGSGFLEREDGRIREVIRTLGRS